MAKKISQLTQATEVKSDDVTVIVQDGETKKLPLNMMVTKQDIENKKVAGLAKLDEIEATYENDTYTPTITVKNKSSVKVGEGDGVDYSANVMDGHAKSAILKGQTLVNISRFTEMSVNSSSVSVDDDGWVTVANPTSQINNAFYGVTGLEKPNTQYTLILEIKENTRTGISSFIQENDFYPSVFNLVQNIIIEGGFVGTKKFLLTTKEDLSDCLVTSRTFVDSSGGTLIFRQAIIEGDYTNVDIPYFEGMTSCKMPVLTTTGKNILNPDNYVLNDKVVLNEDQSLTINTSVASEWNKIYAGLNHIDKYYFKCELVSGEYNGGNIGFFNGDVRLSEGPIFSERIIPNGTDTISIYLPKGNCNIRCSITKDKGVSYEPFKSNILTVNEDVELRGIGDIKDELNVATGELTQRIGEFVVNGAENWSFNTPLSDTTAMFSLGGAFNSLTRSPEGFITDSAYPKHDIYGSERDYEGIELSTTNPRAIFIKVKKSSLNGWDESLSPAQKANLFKSLLSQNPITFQYQLATPVVKTVDLIPSGTHPSTTPYCWKNGHIQLSSSGLLPSLEYSVVTSRAGQISQNVAMIVKNDKRIFDLEILLAGGLVNTTYQALTLQNQVETGLSKVSLSSEKEPDYLLYHMIMKLIEEKAYKLDDLAEKVSVFYLYEKLSDEQFETIYSELYPFVEEEYIELPEDGEIIEEPIVDEVLEEVENGVVM